MTPGQMEVLERLFEEAAAQPPDQLDRWLDAHCEDPEVRQELASIVPHAGTAGGLTALVGAAAAVTAGERPQHERIGPYRIVRILGEGGMGAVFDAERDDDQFHQRVAIKVLHVGMRSPWARDRFLQERRILAQLEHPNIARLLDGGTAPDGAPYIVMEKVDGRPITDFAREKALGPREKLQLFLQVAQAVQHAHQKLIVHRDLKPANILVTDVGVPKLLDFGIAKLVDPEAVGVAPAAPTRTGMQVMTPDYASPEQVRGESISTATDVYALGGLLFELLTGQRPHQLRSYTPAEIHEQVCVRPVPLPSSIGGAALRGDLDTIVVKALQKEPARRYLSAEQLAEDVRRFLDGRPVLARPDTFGYRTGKLLRRHWLPLGAVAAVILALGAGIGVSLHQARLARERFDLVRALSNRFLFEFHSEVTKLPGSTRVQQMVVGTALEYLEKLTRTAGDDPLLLGELAQAYTRLSDIQGAQGVNSSERHDEALASLRKAVALRRKAAGLDPSQRFLLAHTLMDVSFVEDRVSRAKDSLDHVEEGLAILGPLLEKDPKNVDLLLKAGKGEAYRSRYLVRDGRYTEAIQANQRAIDCTSRALAIAPSARLRLNLAIYLIDRGDLLLKAADAEGALRILLRALDLNGELRAADPANPRTLRNRAVALSYLANTCSSLLDLGADRPTEAMAHHRELGAILQQMRAADPADQMTALGLAESDSQSSVPLLALAPEEAVRVGRRSLDFFDGVLRGRSGDRYAEVLRTAALVRQAHVLAATGHAREALALAREAEEALRRPAPDRGDTLEQVESLALVQAIQGESLTLLGRYPEATEAFERGLATAAKLLGRDEPLPSCTLAATYVYDRLASHWKARGDVVQARTWLERSARAWADRPEKTPGVQRRQQLSRARVNGTGP